MIVKFANAPRKTYRRGNDYLGAAAQENSRTPFAHPEGFIEAFANVYLAAAKAISDQIDGTHVAIVTSPSELGTYGAMDTGGFVTAFCLAAQAYGIASIPQAAIAAQAPFVRTFFKISDDQNILCAISFGYSDLDHPANSFRTERASVGDVIEWHE